MTIADPLTNLPRAFVATPAAKPDPYAPVAPPRQLELFAPAAPTRRTVKGRVRFFPRQSKPAAADDPVPFDDPIGF